MTHYKFPVPIAKKDFAQIKMMLEEKSPFVYVRFSDGETEIIRNYYLEIREHKIIWSGGIVNHGYPAFDRKTFNPITDQEFRADLLKSAVENGKNYFKGIPATHNRALRDRNLMIRLNGGLSPSLTFSDLFLNGNFRAYRNQIVPLFDRFANVAVIGNYRMQPNLYKNTWQHIEIPDDFFVTYSDVKKTVWQAIQELPHGSLVLSSASSLSNVMGCLTYFDRPDITFIDIGTSLHDLMGIQTGIRAYHIELEKWTLSNFLRKLWYKRAKEYFLKW